MHGISWKLIAETLYKANMNTSGQNHNLKNVALIGTNRLWSNYAYTLTSIPRHILGVNIVQIKPVK